MSSRVISRPNQSAVTLPSQPGSVVIMNNDNKNPDQATDDAAAAPQINTSKGFAPVAAIRNLLQLTKPSIMMLVVVTGATGLVMQGDFLVKPLDFLLVLLGLFLTGGSANALNQYFERELDAKMTRTAKRRPLPTGKVSPAGALAFSICIGVAGVALFAWRFNILSAAIALGTVLFYGFIYTLYLKPTTHLNIVIGGAAGAMAPVIAWAAATGAVWHSAPWILFAIIFLWTPPHFWALALYLKDDYRKVDLPMMPIVKGDEATLKQIWYYTLAVVAISLTLLFHEPGILYAIAAIGCGAVFIKKSFIARREKTESSERKLFAYSILYLFALFFSIIIEGLTGMV
jgi:protoheme IX farnesyltransferase